MPDALAEARESTTRAQEVIDVERIRRGKAADAQKRTRKIGPGAKVEVCSMIARRSRQHEQEDEPTA